MRYQIRKAQNPVDGSEMYRVYIGSRTAYSRGQYEWRHESTFTSEQKARDYVKRCLQPAAEILIAELGT